LGVDIAAIEGQGAGQDVIAGFLDEVLGMLALLWMIALIAVPIIAERKRLAAWPWLVLTMVFGPFALAAVLMVPEARRYARARPPSTRATRSVLKR
jgi:hypothetical protein